MTLPAMPASSKTFGAALKRKWGVMRAVMLRDMRTRFFNHGLGFLLVAFWPLAHIFALLGIFTLIGRDTPYGESLFVWFATGLIPTLTFMYTSRFMAYSLHQNSPMLKFPVVKPTDILFGRALLEAAAASIACALTFLLLIAFGDDPVPHDIVAVVSAMGVVLVLAVGTGMVVGVLAQLFPFVLTVYTLFTILIYLLSGTLFVVSSMPSQIVRVLSWNPVLHGTEWMRGAYFLGYSDQVLDKGYMVGFAVVTLFLGLLLERLLRPWLLE